MIVEVEKQEGKMLETEASPANPLERSEPKPDKILLEENTREANSKKKKPATPETSLAQTVESQRNELEILRARNRDLLNRYATVDAELASLKSRSFPESVYLSMKAVTSLLRGKDLSNVRIPRISIVTPVYNGEDFIRETIDSVLSQKYPDLEYIVVDGGSTDRTMEIVNEYRDRISHVISEPDGGMYDAIGKGFALSTGDVLGYLNADDMYEPGGLQRVGEYFRGHPNVDVIYHEDTVLVDGWRFPNIRQPNVDLFHLLKGHILFQDGVFFRRSAYQSVGGVRRQMKLAGDWELWACLARKYKFQRLDGHVSCFRIRKGQLSQQRERYFGELEAARIDFINRMSLVGKLRRIPRHVLNKASNFLDRKLRRRTFFYPIDFSATPFPPGEDPGYTPGKPVCPVTKKWPDRLLFSTRDTRFGDYLINHIYFCSNEGIALSYPPLSKEQLNRLYEKHYSKVNAVFLPPDPRFGSPYKQFYNGTLIDKFLRKASLPKSFLDKVDWSDRTCEELLANTRGQVPLRGGNINFLDVGCFQGGLLTDIAKVTDWKTFGLEPNAKAVDIAKAAGHRVWQAYAEDASYVVPEGLQFDLIHMGQTIEHLADPVMVLRRLAGLLRRGGRIVVSTPNLDSKQVELFGPTWSHWHLPYHRILFTKQGLRLTAKHAELELSSIRTYSHPYWTALTLQLNYHGLASAVPHGVEIPENFRHAAIKLTAWANLLWDGRGKGDYMVAVLQKADA